ncbi:MAG: hypothetical protein HOW97_25120 [Catenulispora sp.]|nr:hypothetical protein [Catenulispora sp.]
MITEDELRSVLRNAADDPAADAYTLGLSDRALADARGRGQRRWVRYAPGVAVGTAFVVAGTFGVLALGGGSGGSGGERVTSSNAPQTLANPESKSALLDFEVECVGGKSAPKMAMDWVWDPGSQQYRAVDSNVYTAFTPSPDGKRALVVQTAYPNLRWGVADWDDAVAGRMTYQEIPDGLQGMRWSADGKEVAAALMWADSPGRDGKPDMKSKTLEFFNPATGGKWTVPVPQAVIDRVTSGQWTLQDWEGDHDSVLFPMVSASGDRMEWLDAGGKVTRTLTVQNGLAATTRSMNPMLKAEVSSDGRYLAEANDTTVATFDLQAGGRRIATSQPDLDPTRSYYLAWTGDNEITIAIDEVDKDAGKPGWKMSNTGHSPLYRVYGPDLKVIEESKFVLPADPKGYCASWPITWAPKSQFPGAFVP